MSELLYSVVFLVMVIGILWALIGGLSRTLFHPNPHEGVLGPSIAFVVNVLIVWPIKIVLSLLRFVIRQLSFVMQTSYQHRHLRRRQRQRRSWLAKAAQRSAVRAPRLQRVDLTGDVVELDPDKRPGPAPEDYPRDKFDGLWREHLRRHGGEQQAS